MDKDQQWMQLIPLFKNVFKSMKTEWYRQVDDSLTNTQFSMLYKLNQQGGMKVTDMADILKVTPSALTFISDKLCERGLIARERGDSDRRMVFLQITDKGKELVESLKDSEKLMMKKIADRLSFEDLQHLTRIFTKLTDQNNEKKG